MTGLPLRLLLELAGASSAAGTDITIVQSSNWSNASNTNPVFNSGTGWATPASGNILLCLLLSTASSFTTPSGWNVFLNTSASPRTVLGYWKVSNGTESSVTVGFSTGAATLIELSGANATSPKDGAGNIYQSTSSRTQLSPTLTPANAKTMAIAVIWPNYPNDTFVSSTGWIDLAANSGRIYYNFHVAYKLQDSSLSSVTDTFTNTASTSTAGTALLLVKP